MKKHLRRYLTKSTFQIEPNTIKLSLRDDSLQGLKLLHISDLHIDAKTPMSEIQYLIEMINQIECDYVLLGGDIIDCKVNLIEEKLLFFKDINKTTYFVSGNHDLAYGYKELHDILKSVILSL